MLTFKCLSSIGPSDCSTLRCLQLKHLSGQLRCELTLISRTAALASKQDCSDYDQNTVKLISRSRGIEALFPCPQTYEALCTTRDALDQIRESASITSYNLDAIASHCEALYNEVSRVAHTIRLPSVCHGEGGTLVFPMLAKPPVGLIMPPEEQEKSLSDEDLIIYPETPTLEDLSM